MKDKRERIPLKVQFLLIIAVLWLVLAALFVLGKI